MNLRWYSASVIFIVILSVSCVPTKKLEYFNDINRIEEATLNPRTQKPIMPFDKLFVKVLSVDPGTSQIFNSSEEMRYGGGSAGIIGYTVDESGNINFPFVGDIQVRALTTSQAAVKIQTALNDYVANTSVIVKYIDNQITIIGEVQRPGVYTFTQDKLTVYEAIGLGGGISRYGDRKKVVLVRSEGDKIMHYKLDLSESKLAGTDNYYIIPNDVIVVEPLKSISTSYSNITFTTVLTSIATLVQVLLFIYVVK